MAFLFFIPQNFFKALSFYGHRRVYWLWATCAPQVLNFGNKSLIDYDIALSSQPCMHVAGSESRSYLQPCIPRMVDLLFAIFLARSTSKTCTSGLLFWKVESEEMRKNGLEELEKGLLEEG